MGAADSAPQTFLLTPKLLSGLDFNDHIFVHDIFNGPNVSGISKVRVRCLAICKTLSSGDVTHPKMPT